MILDNLILMLVSCQMVSIVHNRLFMVGEIQLQLTNLLSQLSLTFLSSSLFAWLITFLFIERKIIFIKSQ